MTLIEVIINKLITSKITIATMESCTSGSLISAITNIENSSTITQGGIVTYSTKHKIMCGVSKDVIELFGVYSAETAVEMAKACQNKLNSIIGIGVTGQLGNNEGLNEVHFSIGLYGKFHNFLINAQGSTRKERKEFVVEYILLNLGNLLTYN